MGDDLSLYGRFKRIVAAGGVPQYYVGGNHDLDFDATDDAHSFDTLLVISVHIPFVTYTDATAQKHQVDNLDELYAIVADRPALGLSGHTHTTEQIEPGERFHASFNTPRFRRWAADLFAYVDLYGAPSDIPPPVTINDLGDMNLLTRADLRGGDDTAGFTIWRGVRWSGVAGPFPAGMLTKRSSHLWRADLPADLPAGVHTLEVSTTDRYGRTFRATSTFEVVETIPEMGWNGAF